MYQAVTDIKHGTEDGEIVTVNAGEEVPEASFTDEELTRFLEIGAIVEPVVFEAAGRSFDSIEDIEAEVARLQSLKAQLENGTLEGVAEGSTAPGNADGGTPVDPDAFGEGVVDLDEIT